MTRSALLALFLALALPAVLSAQVPDSIEGEAGLVFSYQPLPGQESQFFDGYRSHLDWHREHDDPFTWYGWTVLTGDRVGTFVDGTFGISYEAFGNRVKPQEDRSHFENSVAPYAEVLARKLFRLERDLSTAFPLEEQKPSRFVDAYTFSVAPGKEPLFEEILSELAGAGGEPESGMRVTVYRQLTGGVLPAYLVLVPREGFAAFDPRGAITTLGHAIERTFPEPRADALLDRFSASVEVVQGETWAYRSDLSYFPAEK